jgi:hypothetical protein
MDLMPARVREAVALDKSRPEANRANIALDGRSGRLTVEVPDLQAKSVKAGGVSTGPVQAKGVVLTVDNAAATAKDAVRGLVGGAGSKDAGGAARPSGARLSVGSATAQNVRVAGKGGRPSTQAGAVKVDGVEVAMEEVQAKPGATPGVRAQASVAGVRATDVRTGTGTAERVDARGLSGAIEAGGERGHVAATHVGVEGLKRTSAPGALEEASLQNLRADFTNKGGGLPGADATPDRDLTARATASSVHARGAVSPSARVGRLDASAIGVDFAAGRTGVRVGSLDVDEADVQGARVGHVDASGVAVDSGDDGLALRADAARLHRVDTDDVDVAAASARDLAVRRTAAGAQLRAGTASVEGVDTRKVDLARGSAEGLSLSVGSGGVALDARRAAVAGLDTEALDARSVNATGLSLASQGKAARVSADALDAHGVTAPDVRVADVAVGGLEVARGAQGDLEGSARRVVARGVDTQRTDAASLEASGVRVRSDRQGAALDAASVQATQFATGDTRARAVSASGLAVRQSDASRSTRLEDVSVRGLDTPGLDAETMAASALHYRTDADGVRLDAARIAGAGVETGTVRAGALDARGVALATSADRTSGSARLDALRADDVRAPDASARAVDVQGLDVSGRKAATGLETRGTLAGASVEGVRSKAAEIGSARVSDAAWNLAGERGEASIARAGASSVRLADGTRAETAHVAGLAASRGDGVDALRVQGASATGIRSQRADADVVDVHRLEATSRSGDQAVRAEQARASGVTVREGGTTLRVAGAEVQGGHARLRDGLDAGAEAVRARGLVFDSTLSSGRASEDDGGALPSRAVSGQDDRLDLLGLARQVETADVRASVPLHPGKVGPLDIERDTRANARVVVQDGTVDTDATNLRLSKPLDGPLWTDVKGVYLQDGKEPGTMKAKADVGGFVDLDVGKRLPGEGPLPTDVGALVDRFRSAPGTPGNADRGPASPRGPDDAAKPGVDLAGLSVKGSAQLASGQADLGGARVDFQRQAPTDNAVSFDVTRDRAALQIDRVLTGGVDVKAGQQETHIGATRASGLSLDVKRTADGQEVHGALPEVELKDVRTRPKARR